MRYISRHIERNNLIGLVIFLEFDGVVAKVLESLWGKDGFSRATSAYDRWGPSVALAAMISSCSRARYSSSVIHSSISTIYLPISCIISSYFATACCSSLVISICSFSASYSLLVSLRDSASRSSAFYSMALPSLPPLLPLPLLFRVSVSRSIYSSVGTFRIVYRVFHRVSIAVSSDCRAVSRNLLIGFTTRLGRFGVEKGASYSTTTSVPIGSAMTVGSTTSTHTSQSDQQQQSSDSLRCG
jgi:hypothetical protein